MEVQEAVHNYAFVHNKRRWDWHEIIPISFQILAVRLDSATQLSNPILKQNGLAQSPKPITISEFEC